MGFLTVSKSKIIILGALFSAITGCGGGSSSAGGSAEVLFVTVQPGFYRGTRTFVFTGNGVSSDPGMSPITLTVTGLPPGQQVRIAFRQFSGSSSIDSNQEFSIPSGTFRTPTGTGTTCESTTNFTGRFVGNTVTGNETGTFNCPDIPGVITLEGTFEANFSLSKEAILETDFPMDIDGF